MDNILMTDFEVDDRWDFLRALELVSNKQWKVINGAPNKKHGSKRQKLIRYFDYFYLPFKIFLNRKNVKNVLAWQQFYGLVLAFYFICFHINKVPNIVVMTFIYKPKKGFIGKIYSKFINTIVKSGIVSTFIVFSNSEARYYAELFGVSSDVFHVERLGIDDRANAFDIIGNSSEKYYLSAGRSNRDYQFLSNSWEWNFPIYIISDECKDEDKNNIIHLANCYGDEYLDKLCKSHVVIVPLENTHISSGQLVILQAFMFGKPVIVTENDAVRDYVTDGLNGFVIKKEKEELLKALEQIEIVYQIMSENARNTFLENYSVSAMGRRIGTLFGNS